MFNSTESVVTSMWHFSSHMHPCIGRLRWVANEFCYLIQLGHRCTRRCLPSRGHLWQWDSFTWISQHIKQIGDRLPPLPVYKLPIRCLHRCKIVKESFSALTGWYLVAKSSKRPGRDRSGRNCLQGQSWWVWVWERKWTERDAHWVVT